MGFHHWPTAVLVGRLVSHCLSWFWVWAATPLCSKCLDIPLSSRSRQVSQATVSCAVPLALKGWRRGCSLQLPTKGSILLHSPHTWLLLRQAETVCSGTGEWNGAIRHQRRKLLCLLGSKPQDLSDLNISAHDKISLTDRRAQICHHLGCEAAVCGCFKGPC